MKGKIMIAAALGAFLNAGAARALTLDGALDAALKNSPALNMAREAADSQRYKKYGARVSRLGEVTAIGTLTRYNLERTLTPMVPPIKPPFPLADDTVTNVGGSYTLPLFTGFKLSRNISIAGLSAAISEAQSSLTEKQVKFNVYSLFLKGLALGDQLRARTDQEKALAELHKNIELGVKIGRYAAIDLKKVDYQYEMVKAQRQGLENNIASLKAGLDQLTGLASDDWDFEPAALAEKDYPPLEALVGSALAAREEMRISADRKKIAAANYSKSKYAYLPELSANYTYIRSIGGGGSVPLWNYGLAAQWSVFDFGKRAFDMAGQKREYRGAEEAETAQRLAVRREVVEAYNSLQSQRALHEAAAKALAYAEEAKNVENLKYQQGAGSMYDLLFSLAQYYDALSQERGAYYGVFTAGKYLELSAGEKI